MKKDRINIVYEDKDIIVVNKPAGLLTIATNNEKDNTLFHKTLLYLKSKNKNNKVFIVHRLDRETSGLIVLAKSEKVKKILQDNWNEQVTRQYVAVVEGITAEQGTIKSWLKETSTLLTYVSEKENDGELAITNYQRVGHNRKYSLIKINIATGKKHQIRVQLNSIAHPITGDKKYGATKNPINRLALHAYYLSFLHPVTKEKLIFEIKYPQEFDKLII